MGLRITMAWFALATLAPRRDWAREICLTEAMLEELSKVLRYPRLQSRLQSIGITSDELITYVSQCATFFESPPISFSGVPLLEAQYLAESAILYAELYDEDTVLQALTELAMVGWPE